VARCAWKPGECEQQVFTGGGRYCYYHNKVVHPPVPPPPLTEEATRTRSVVPPGEPSLKELLEAAELVWRREASERAGFPDEAADHLLRARLPRPG
jgi:hypothetical protein